MTSKVYKVTLTLPDLAAAHAEQEVRVETTSWTTAIKLACDEISRRPHVRGKHIKSAKLFFSQVGTSDNLPAEKKTKPAKKAKASAAQGALFDK
ncbi:MAG: hypothetical protein AB1757_02365 [Acidobacteriota bacterium]